MPPRGWKKPPNYSGYQRKSTRKRTPSVRLQRTCGPEMLQRMQEANEATANEQDEVDIDDPEEVEERISSRLRRGAPAQYAGDDEDEEEPELNENEHEPDQTPDLNCGSSGDDSDGDEPIQPPAARKRQRSAQVVSPTPSCAVDEDGLPIDRPPTYNTMIDPQMISMTLSKKGGHVPPVWAQLVHNWMLQRCIRGSVSLERGGKKQHLHCQIMFEMRMDPKDMNALKEEIKTLVGWKRGDGSGTYCQAHVFGVGQVLCQIPRRSPVKI